MITYDKIFVILQEKVDNEELTYEQACLVNDLAYGKYVKEATRYAKEIHKMSKDKDNYDKEDRKDLKAMDTIRYGNKIAKKIVKGKGIQGKDLMKARNAKEWNKLTTGQLDDVDYDYEYDDDEETNHNYNPKPAPHKQHGEIMNLQGLKKAGIKKH